MTYPYKKRRRRIMGLCVLVPHIHPRVYMQRHLSIVVKKIKLYIYNHSY